MQPSQHQQGEGQPQGEGLIELMANGIALRLQPAEGGSPHHQGQGQQLQAEAGESKGEQDGGGEAVEQAHQPVFEQGGHPEGEGGQTEPEPRDVQIQPVQQAVEQPGIGGQRQRQHELIPEVGAGRHAIEAEGGGHQHGPHGEGVVRLPGEALEGHEQEEEQEEGGYPAHHAEQEAARPVGLLVTGASPSTRRAARSRSQGVRSDMLPPLLLQPAAGQDRQTDGDKGEQQEAVHVGLHPLAKGREDHGDEAQAPHGETGDESVVPAQVGGAEPGEPDGPDPGGGGIEQGQQGQQGDAEPGGQPGNPGGHEGEAGGGQDEQAPEGGIEQGQAPAEGLLVEGEEEVEQAEAPVEHQGELAEQPGERPEQRAPAERRQGQQQQGPGGEQLPGIGAGLVGLAHQGQQGAEVEGQGQQQALARRVGQGPAPEHHQHGEQGQLQQGEAREAAERLPVEGDEEHQARAEAEAAEPEQQAIEQPLPAGGAGGQIAQCQGGGQGLPGEVTASDPVEQGLS